MANHKSAKKRIRSNEAKRIRNKALTSELKTIIKKVYSTEDKAQAETFLKEAVSALDRVASKGTLHKNNVARKKSQLARHVNKIAVATK